MVWNTYYVISRFIRKENLNYPILSRSTSNIHLRKNNIPTFHLNKCESELHVRLLLISPFSKIFFDYYTEISSLNAEQTKFIQEGKEIKHRKTREEEKTRGGIPKRYRFRDEPPDPFFSTARPLWKEARPEKSSMADQWRGPIVACSVASCTSLRGSRYFDSRPFFFASETP